MMPAAPSPSVGQLRALCRRLDGEVLVPGNAGYDATRRAWNGRFDRRPAVIARCTGPADVQAAVNFARTADLLVAVRGGGHSLSGWSTCDGGLLVDLSPMRAIWVDPLSRTVRAEAGVLWGELDRATQDHGLALTGGHVSHTGIAGLTLGGGTGWLARKHGLTVDSLLSVEMITAGETYVTANERENTDLFWGIRGGGGNFGVVTSFRYRLHAVGPLVTGGMVLYPLRQAGRVLRSLRATVRTAPDELAVSLLFLTASPAPHVPRSLKGQPTLAIAMCHCGLPADGERIAARLRASGTPEGDLLRRLPYVEVQQMLDQTAPHGALYEGRAHSLDELSDDLIEVVVRFMGTAPSPHTIATIDVLGGAIARAPEDTTARGHRDASFILNIVSQWHDSSDSDRQIAWTRRFWEVLRPYARNNIDANFLGAGEETRIRTAYTSESFERLVTLKNRYDPTNLFQLNHNIPPTVHGSTTCSPLIRKERMT